MKTVLALALFAIGSNSLADVSLTDLDLKSIETSWDKQGIIFRVSNPPEHCGGQFKVWTDENPYEKEILSIALSALHAGKKVDFRVREECRGDRNNIIAIEIHR